ncbi:MAG: serine/threonine-protein kinase [Candidatus Latescibacteria bacterium]|nr:serine/threonine-protein kinase [Candidatus Latescibacterota bacterium]
MNLLTCHAAGANPLETQLPWSDQPAVPSSLGPYRVLDLLGQGGMGVVYRAQATSGGATAPIVALKALRPGVVTTQLEQRFRREVAVLRRLDHPGIARLLDAGSADGSPYLAMEFVEGLTLTRWRIEADPPVVDRLRLLAELCDAVEYAHQQGVIHRDLKPENILVTAAGRPKVLDFGIARLTDPDAPAQTLATQTWQLLGTIRYMSPEQATGGPGAIDARTDVYALGVIAFELLTGGLPYDLARLSTPRALLEITTAAPRRLPDTDAAVGLIVHHALEKDPQQRYQSAADMAADLRRHLAGRPITLHEPGLATRLRRWLRLRPRVRRLVLGVAIATIAVVATLVLVPGLLSGPPVTWAGLYSRLEEADQLRHSGPQNRENYLAAAALFQQARSDLSRLPVEPFTADLNRYIKWRQGELHYFVGEMEHDAAMLEQARGFWRDASVVPWVPGTALGIDSLAIVRDKVLRLGAHHPHAGIGFALASLARLQAPATNWREASLAQGQAVGVFSNGVFNYQINRHTREDSLLRAEDLAYALLNQGGALTALGATIDSLAVVDTGLATLREAAGKSRVLKSGGMSMLAQALGAAYFRRAELLSGTAVAAELDSALTYFDRAAELCDLGAGRSYWQLYLLRGRVRGVAAASAADGNERRQLLELAAFEIRNSFTPLRDDTDDFERALSQADLAVVTAQLAALDRDRGGFVRADSLLTAAESVLTSARFPVQYAEIALRRGQAGRMRWVSFGDAADSTASVSSLERARAAIPRVEYPALHRQVRVELALLAGRRP